MPTNLLLLPLLGGYFLIHTLWYTRFRAERLDGYRLLLEAAAWGLLLTAIARTLASLLVLLPGVLPVWNALAPRNIDYLGTAVLAFLMGVFAPFLLNRLFRQLNLRVQNAGGAPGWLTHLTGEWSEDGARRHAILRHGNDLLRIFHRAESLEKPVQITLDSRKVYIGLLENAPTLQTHETFVKIAPLYSGYRDKDTLNLRLSVYYLDVSQDKGLDPSEFSVVLAMASIRSAGLFEYRIYEKFVVEEPAEPGDFIPEETDS